MKQKVEQIRLEAENEIKQINDTADLERVRLDLIGKKGKVSLLMQELKNIPNDQKREAGQLINMLKNEVEKALQENKEILQQQEI